jgi:hypothetical protein
MRRLEHEQNKWAGSDGDGDGDGEGGSAAAEDADSVPSLLREYWVTAQVRLRDEKGSLSSCFGVVTRVIELARAVLLARPHCAARADIVTICAEVFHACVGERAGGRFRAMQGAASVGAGTDADALAYAVNQVQTKTQDTNKPIYNIQTNQ